MTDSLNADNRNKYMIELARQVCTYVRHYSFLGNPVSVFADDPKMIDLFHGMYRCFSSADPGLNSRTFYSVTHPENGPPFVLHDDLIEPLMDSPRRHSHAYMIILNRILAVIHDFYLIHAGSVVAGDRAILLIGGSGFGKTTLILELLHRGLGLLSDEFASLHRHDNLVHAFPRSLGIRETAFSLFADLDQSKMVRVKNIGRGHKQLLDPTRIPGVRIAKPTAISHIFVIGAGKSDQAEEAICMDLALQRPQPELLVRLQSLPGVSLESTGDEDDYTVWRYRVDQQVSLEFSNICDEARSAILYCERIHQNRPDFTQPARVEKMSKSQAAMLLLRNLRNRVGCFGSEEGFRRATSRTYMDLVSRVKTISCHELVVGDLKDTADKILMTVGNQHKEGLN